MSQPPVRNKFFVIERCDHPEGWAVRDYKDSTEGFAEPYLYGSRDAAWIAIQEELELQKEYKMAEIAELDEFRIVAHEQATFSDELISKLHPCDKLMYKHMKTYIVMEMADEMGKMMQICAYQEALLKKLYVEGATGSHTQEVRDAIAGTEDFVKNTTIALGLRNAQREVESEDGRQDE